MNKIRRNDLCPCGSGRKYKRCCSRKTAQHTDHFPTIDNQQPISGSALASFNQGNNLAAQGKLDQAVSALRAAIAMQPDAAFIHSNLGGILHRMGRFDEAIEAYRRALSIQPELAEVRSNLGLTLQAMGKLDAAVQSYRTALSIKPNYAAAHFNLGVALQKQGEDQAAAESYQRMLALQPDYAQAHSNLGAALESQGKADDAVNSYRRALDCDPTLLAAQNGLDRTLSKLVPQWHLPMMNDSKRNEAYFAALNAAVTPHSTVLEIGTGSGLLSMMAAKLGAAEVTTCESEPLVAATAKRIIADNGFDQRIKVIAKKSTDVMLRTDLTQPADIFVQEIFSSELLAERVLSTIEDAKRRLLKQDCKM
ncbi:MAG: tetratricopeptide repeat protein, partial [Betaproteobacteria bacterium]|nr:tetratricopeptide repeat protein [Betaproteobacteria bacterium]